MFTKCSEKNLEHVRSVGRMKIVLRDPLLYNSAPFTYKNFEMDTECLPFPNKERNISEVLILNMSKLLTFQESQKLFT